MNTNRKTGNVGNQNQPAVGMGLISMILPFQDQPEYQGCKGGRVGIYLSFHCTEPEGVAECVDQRSYHTGSLNSNQFL